MNKSGVATLHRAASTGDATVASQLLQANANVDAAPKGGWTALHWAAYKGHLGVVKSLLQAKACPTAVTKDGDTPLQLAELWLHPEVAALLQRA